MDENKIKPVILELDSYNIEKASEALFMKIINDKPYLTKSQIAKQLGVAERTIYRWVDKYKIEFFPRGTSIQKAIELLETSGFNVTKKEEENGTTKD